MVAAEHLRELHAAITACRARQPGPMLVALDGRSGTGKSTITVALAELVGGVAVSADDFWAGGEDALWHARTPAQRVADGIDWRRLRREVLEPLRDNQPARYRPFDFQAGCGLGAPVYVPSTPVIVVDGAYCARPELRDLIDLTVLVVLDDAERRRRLLAREGDAFMTAWHRLWDPAEQLYFTEICPPQRFDVVLDGDTLERDS